MLIAHVICIPIVIVHDCVASSCTRASRSLSRHTSPRLTQRDRGRAKPNSGLQCDAVKYVADIHEILKAVAANSVALYAKRTGSFTLYLFMLCFSHMFSRAGVQQLSHFLYSTSKWRLKSRTATYNATPS